jgi:hypothetical protein
MGEDVRKQAKGILEAELPEGVRYASDNGKRYEELTGYSHATLKANWAKGGQLTACMGYVAHYCSRMGITPNLGRFDLETYLPTIQKEYSWVRSMPGRRPQYGDILLHQGVHIDVSMGFDSNNPDILIRGAAGQGSVGTHDVVCRVRGTAAYNAGKLKGWVDIERYLGAIAAPLPAPWLTGWWKVWDGNTYYYYFGNGGFVQYTKTAPGSALPPTRPVGQGDYTLTSGTLVITWNPVGGSATVETFRNAVAGAQQMNGTSSRYSPLVATRI